LPMPTSSLPVMCRSTVSNQHAQAQSLHNQMLHMCWQSISKFTNMEKKRWTHICSSSRCLTWRSVATVELIQHVVLLIWQALLDAICDHTVKPTHAGLDNSVLYAADPAWPGDCVCAFSPETGHVICSHAQFQIIQDSCRPCSVCSKGNSKIAAESFIYLKQRCTL